MNSWHETETCARLGGKTPLFPAAKKIPLAINNVG